MTHRNPKSRKTVNRILAVVVVTTVIGLVVRPTSGTRTPSHTLPHRLLTADVRARSMLDGGPLEGWCKDRNAFFLHWADPLLIAYSRISKRLPRRISLAII